MATPIVIHHTTLDELVEAHGDMPGAIYVGVYHSARSTEGGQRQTVQSCVRYVDKAGHVHSYTPEKQTLAVMMMIDRDSVQQQLNEFVGICEDVNAAIKGHLIAAGIKVYSGIVDMGDVETFSGKKFQG